MKDRIFLQKHGKQFEFDTRVASVFDDMLERSVPFYKENLNLCVDFLALNIPPRAIVYDVGCSTGNLLLELFSRLPDSHLIGLDTSHAMLERARLKAEAYNAHIFFKLADCLKEEFLQSHAIVSNYTLQFIRPPLRTNLLKKLYASLKPNNGIFIMSEKMICKDSLLNQQMIRYYHQYKEHNGYSKSEIAHKRESLENVLVPYSLEENIKLLEDCGFTNIEVLFKWVNFGTLIAKAN
ncbi:MAG: carboxy-S-adenosyl-L-methionine synthase CmoA [Helicobacter sp.]|nr:carboxy-S-adenosyl-L-methionine synthase CmoA [Helicobacter sp.]MDY5741051.1 carboxy-S-adenosyl-L-methionine synthase CmoA [Helicobacter sp.]